jgi:hypothetical protein
MTKLRRNEPCPCGSNLKAKRCCLAEEETKITTPRATLARLQTSVVEAISYIDPTEFRALYEEMVYLPELDVSLHLRLPSLVTLEVEAAMAAITHKDDDGLEDALRELAATLNTVERRLELAEAVLKLRDRGLIAPELAAVSIFDLNNEDSALFISSLAQAIAVKSGSEPTPAGLLLAG